MVKIFLKNNSQFIPNSSIFFIVLVAADRSRDTIQSLGFLVYELDQKLKCYQVSHVASNKRIKRLSIFASFRKNYFSYLSNKSLSFIFTNTHAVVIFCGINIATLHYASGVNTSNIDSIFYWLSFVVAKIGLLTFNFMYSLYMTVLLERLKIVCRTIE